MDCPRYGVGVRCQRGSLLVAASLLTRLEEHFDRRAHDFAKDVAVSLAEMSPARRRELCPRLLDPDQQLLGANLEAMRLEADRVHRPLECGCLRTRRMHVHVERWSRLFGQCAQKLSLGNQ